MRISLIAGGSNQQLLFLDDATDAACAMAESGKTIAPGQFAPDLFS